MLTNHKPTCLDHWWCHELGWSSRTSIV